MRFLLDSINIEKFRKLIEIDEIHFGSKITLFSGQNGVGKSNLLSIISSCSGTNSKRLNDGRFQPEFSDYFNINDEEHFPEYKLYIKYKVNEDFITKRVSFKNDTKTNRGIRIIPRTNVWPTEKGNVKLKEKEAKEKYNVGPAARITMPTLYVSLSRIFPIGETEIETKVLKKSTKIIQGNYNLKFKEWYNHVFPNSISNDIEQMEVIKKESSKRSDFYMEINNTQSNTQSIGQDNLRNIITALVDFYALSQSEEYNGGILCIDEIDSSLHPSAQIRLISLLSALADDLKLQILISSHSLTIIKEILIMHNKNPSEYKLVYLKGTRTPIVSTINNYETLKADLFQQTNPIPPVLKVYCEDNMTQKLMELLINTAISLKIPIKLPRYKVIPAELGEGHLKNLPSKDSYFNSVQIILDGDAKTNSKINIKEFIGNPDQVKGYNPVKVRENIAFLPSYLSPESYLYYIIHKFVTEDITYLDFWRGLEANPDTTNYTSDKVMETILLDSDSLSTDAVKKKSNLIIEFAEKSQILEYYYSLEQNIGELNEFISCLQKSMNYTYKIMLSKRF